MDAYLAPRAWIISGPSTAEFTAAVTVCPEVLDMSPVAASSKLAGEVAVMLFPQATTAALVDGADRKTKVAMEAMTGGLVRVRVHLAAHARVQAADIKVTWTKFMEMDHIKAEITQG